MRHTAFALVALMSAVALTSPVEAGDWYRSPWFWGGTGLVVGGVVGHEIGRAHRPVYYDHANYSYSPYVAAGPANDVYYRETRVWPFYRRIESYPVAGTATLGRGQATSNSAILPHRMMDDYSSPEDRPLTINVGDNNENISIVLDGNGRQREVEFKRVTVTNTGRGTQARSIDAVVVDSPEPAPEAVTEQPAPEQPVAEQPAVVEPETTKE